jgi:hypothetical protein
MTARYVVAAVSILVGLIFIGQGLGFIGGSGMTGQPVWAVVGVVLVVIGGALVWATRRSRTS